MDSRKLTMKFIPQPPFFACLGAATIQLYHSSKNLSTKLTYKKERLIRSFFDSLYNLVGDNADYNSRYKSRNKQRGIIIQKRRGIQHYSRGYKLLVTIDVPFGTQLTGKVHKLQQYIIDKIESFTGILIEDVNIIIDKIITLNSNM